MIRRYRRKPVCNTLEICCLLQSNSDSHPLPDKQVEYSAPSPITSIEDADSISSGESKISEVTVSHLLLADGGHPWSAVNSYTETRLSTACSSTYSWGDNEFETAASQKVQQMFFEIDELLFEEKKCLHVQGLEAECQEWKCHFPHFRVLGTQIAAPVNEAYGWYPGREEGKTLQTISCPGSSTAGNELCLIGKSAIFSGLSLCKGNEFMQKTAMLPWEEEEKEPENNVIIAEGIVEDYLALHYKDQDDDCFETRLDHSLQYKCRRGLPPISPNHCRRDAIVTELFDEVWLELVGCMEDLIRKHWDYHASDEEKNISPNEDTGYKPFNFLLPPVPQKLQYKTSARDYKEWWSQPFPPQIQLSPALSTSARVDASGRRHPSLGPTPSGPCPLLSAAIKNEVQEPEDPHPKVRQTHSGMVQTRLSSLHIQGIPLSRGNPLVPKKIKGSDEKPVQRPYSSNHSANRFPSNHLREHSIYSLPQPVLSAQRHNAPRTLHPLHSSLSLSRTPVGFINEVVRGIGLQSARGCLSASTQFLRHNALLPPIGSTDIGHSAAKLSEQPQKSQIHSNRTQSAIISERSHLPPRDKYVGNKYFTRPKTTHTFQEEENRGP
ncbi:protein FAM149B1 isoform X2 [Hemitrygon akajei]|uniref:protein FAM149B1 isoform X2 n=1 Tax=Hemitrygon akajei TaxID=2704970 RepID=UPI003BF9F651